MTNRVKVAAMFQVLSLASMYGTELKFRKLVQDQDPDRFWSYYEACLRRRAEIDPQVEQWGKVSFRMLKPAIEAIFKVTEPKARKARRPITP